MVSQQIAVEIRRNVPVGSTIAINHAGALPYFLPEYHFIDMTGLNDHHIARKEGELNAKFDSEYILEKQPSLVVLNSFSEPQKQGFVPDYWVGETDLYRQESFPKQYVAIATYWERVRSGGGKAYTFLFQRRADIPKNVTQ